MKKWKKIILGILWLIIIISWMGFLTRIVYDLKDTDIKENIVVTLKWKQGLYLLNPNTENIVSFSWSYNVVQQTEMDLNTKMYNREKKYYFSIEWVFTDKGNVLNTTWLCPIKTCQALWTEDGKYLIRTDGHVVRMFWLFFSTPTVEQVLHVVEPSTKKSKQILLYDENWILMQVDKILGYTK